MKKLLASAPTKEELEKLINEYFASQNYVITDMNRVRNLKTGYTPNNLIISIRGNKWRLYREDHND